MIMKCHFSILDTSGLVPKQKSQVEEEGKDSRSGRCLPGQTISNLSPSSHGSHPLPTIPHQMDSAHPHTLPFSHPHSISSQPPSLHPHPPLSPLLTHPHLPPPLSPSLPAHRSQNISTNSHYCSKMTTPLHSFTSLCF